MRTFFNIFLLRQSPAELPYSKSLLGMLCLLDLAANLAAVEVMIAIAKQNPETAARVADISTESMIQVICIALALLFGFVYCLLSLYQKQSRFVQVMIALVALDIMLSALSFGILILAFIPFLALVYYIVLLYWEFLIYAHVFAKGLDFDMLKACLISLVFLILKHNIVEWVFKSL